MDYSSGADEPLEWPNGGPARPMTAAEQEVRDKYAETLRRMLLRVGTLACAAVVVRLPSGDEGIGTAFHVGEGVYLTARHIVEGNEILAISPHTDGYLFRDELLVEVATLESLRGQIPIWYLHHQDPRVERGPFYHPKAEIDVAAIVVGGLDPNTPYMPLGHHYDDWIIDRDWLLTTGTAIGYPPVPTSYNPVQIVATVEVNGVIDTYRDRHVRFVVSGPPRGGFSGGPVFHEYGFVLGMVIESLERLDHPEPGFFTVLNIDPLHEVLDHHEIVPACQELSAEKEAAIRAAGRVPATNGQLRWYS